MSSIMSEIKAHFSSRFSGAGVPEAAPVKVVGVYSELSDYLMATHQLQRIANRSPSVGDFQSSWWSFEALEHPQERQKAARAAAEADIIWCSSCACEPLPDAVRAWMHNWSAHKGKPDAALVSCLRCPLNGDFEQSPTRLCLCKAALAAGAEFFERRLVCDCPQADNPLRGMAMPPLPLNPPGEKQIRWWGINE